MIRRMNICVGQTDMDVVADENLRETIYEYVVEARAIIEEKISMDSFFALTYDSYKPENRDHPLIRSMCEASVLAGVGPMASVAGAVADYTICHLVENGCCYAVLDNGGDIAMISDRDVVVRVFSGNDSVDGIGMAVGPFDGVLSICSSSGKIGHSVSFGDADVCTVVSSDPVLADACATAMGNRISDGDDLSEALERTCEVKGVRGCFASINGLVASCGDIPEFVILEDCVP